MTEQAPVLKLGMSFPQNEIGSDPIAIRDFAQAVDDEGFDYLAAIEHVSGAHPDRFAGVDTGFPSPPYDYHHHFHEPFSLFSYLAGLTKRIEFATGVLVLPQRQTVLVAKQAAEVDILSGARFRLGVGVGWNHAEFQSLGADFHSRGRRIEEQIVLLRRLWSEELVSFHGRWHTLDRVAIAPLPAHTIPIWLGGGWTDALLARAARLADGWIPNVRRRDAPDVFARLRRHLAEQGRDVASFGIQVPVRISDDASDSLLSTVFEWRKLGATHITLIETPGMAPPRTLAQAIAAKQKIQGELG
jgi:probable F420-dependent oxidoreductase